MSNFRAPANIFLSTLHKAHYCSGSSEKTGLGLLKQVQVVVEDKIKPEKLENLLPNAQHRENEITQFKLTEEQVTVTNEVTNICDPQLVQKESDQLNTIKLSDQILSPEGCSPKLISCDIHKTSKDSSESIVTPVDFQAPPQSLPTLIVAKEKTQTMDLSNAILPLSLHLRGKNNLLVEAVIQDIKTVYFKTSSTIDGWNIMARTHGKAFYTKAEKIMKDPSSVQNFLREQIVSISLQRKDGLSIYSPKSIAIVNASEPSIVDKIKKVIENIIESIKKMINKESKSSGGKKKKEEKKSQDEEKD